MPLLKPEIQEALREAGLGPKKGSLSDKLDSNSLSLDDSIEILSDLAHGSSNEQLRLKAVETSLKLHGALKDQPSQIPSITIVISDPKKPEGINPIILPRQLLKEDVIQ